MASTSGWVQCEWTTHSRARAVSVESMTTASSHLRQTERLDGGDRPVFQDRRQVFRYDVHEAGNCRQVGAPQLGVRANRADERSDRRGVPAHVAPAGLDRLAGRVGGNGASLPAAFVLKRALL